jgi:hypothetical protein
MAEKYRKAYPLGSAYVNTFDSHPMFNFRQERNRRYTTLSYVNAVRRDQNPPTQEELRHAYHVAGDSFVGLLKETFLVLDDDVAKKGSNAGGKNKASKPGKRRASIESANDTKKKVSATQ